VSNTLPATCEQKLIAFARALVDQQNARTVVAPQQNASGFWFGGGNMVQSPAGDLYLCGRYRSHGDSRTGLASGERGLEFAVFKSAADAGAFEKVLSIPKAGLSVNGMDILSIEGSALTFSPRGVELFVSTEKAGLPYPAELSGYLKPGAGVWTIEHACAASVEELAAAELRTVVATGNPEFLHVKDPFVYNTPQNDLALLFCTHPFSWSSSNTAYVLRVEDNETGGGTFSEPDFSFFPRGNTWDVAMTRGTCLLDVPASNACDGRRVTLIFYDGGECLRNLDEHCAAVKRPRGYSCEEIGGAAYMLDGDFNNIVRLSRNEPLFTSPYGTGCSRYVDVLATSDHFHATWQQSQNDLSQPLVLNSLSRRQALEILN